MVLPGWGGSVLLMCMSFALDGLASLSGDLPPPENLSLSWDSSVLSLRVNWREPVGLGTDCKVNYTIAIYNEQKCPPRSNTSEKHRTDRLNFEHSISKEDEICVGITTNPMDCENKKASKEVYKHLSPPRALVKNFNCVYYANETMNCTWTVVKSTPDLQLFYREEQNNKAILKHCMSYITYGNMKTGCHLHDKGLTFQKNVYFVINGTGENQLINNRFMVDISESVKILKPKVSITQEGERLHFQTITSNFIPSHCLKYKYFYSRCKKESEEEAQEMSSVYVEYDTGCRYTVRGQVIYSSLCGGKQEIESDISEPEYFGEDGDPNLPFKVAMIITPVMVCCSLIVAIVLFRRNKDIILPKIPEPSMFFKDMLNSTTDGLSKSLGGGKLYVPVKEIVASGVNVEPKSALLHPNHESCI
ncbi:interleukin-13 receptor subunit alpha-2-like isoform X1 [Silurus meridionalis]|uniref:Type I cytokine receptor cytokine-binding domain-containing protein n=1 Tax=Silurus meridionalis TaxID=175797 RepID=A0A8T0BGX5_SILME|nr:interleukin-13 receptor subunit alpha-2-like isoform X1 [Silurus meridionalis]KAF7706264.1 hypothetical protein HF521_019518 [Silurus meridionalis]